MNTYLNLDMSTGRLFEYSKDEKEGFEIHTFENKKDNTVKTSYRKWYNEGAYGSLKSLCTTEKKLGAVNALHFRIVLQDAEQNNLVIDFPMKNMRNQWNDFAVSILLRLQFLEADKCYRFFPYVIEDEKNLDKNGKPRKSYGFAINYARLEPLGVDKVNKIPSLTRTYTKKGEDGTPVLVKGDVPAIVWAEGVGDKMELDTKERDLFLWNSVLKPHKIGADFKLGGSKVAEFDSTKEPVAAPTAKASTASAAPAAKSTPTTSTPNTVGTGKSAMERARPVDGPTRSNVTTTPTIEDDEDGDLPF